MLTNKFKQSAVMAHNMSYLAYFCRSMGLSSEDTLGLLTILESFHQNAASFLIYDLDRCNVESNDHIDFVVKDCDHRNYRCYDHVSQQLETQGHLELASMTRLWNVQMYLLLRLHSLAAQYVLSTRHYTDDEIVEGLLSDLSRTCMSIMTRGKTSSVTPENAEALKVYGDKFVQRLFGIQTMDMDSMHNILHSMICSVRGSYLQVIEGLDKVQDKETLMKLVTLVVYKSAISRFMNINPDFFSQTLRKKAYSVLHGFICDGTDKLPISCRSRLGMGMAPSLVLFYKNLFSVFHQGSISDCYGDEIRYNISVFNDVCLATRGSLAIVANEPVPYNPFSSRMTHFAYYDATLAVNGIFHHPKLDNVLKLESMTQMYKMSLEGNPSDLHCLFVSGLGRMNFSFEDKGEPNSGLEMLCELLSMCYYAVFVARQPLSLVRGIFNICYGKLGDLGDKVNVGSVAGSKLAIESYRDAFNAAQAALHCTGINPSDVIFKKETLLILVQHLLLGEVAQEKIEDSKLAFDIFELCKPVNEVKAQQAAMMMCQAFRGSNGVVDGYEVGNLGAIVLKLLFGNFVERNLILKLLDITCVACDRYKMQGAVQDMYNELLKDFMSCADVCLSLFRYAGSSLPMCYSSQVVAGLDGDSCAVYSQMYNMLSSYASRLNVSQDDLIRARNSRFSVSFAELFSNAVLPHGEQSGPELQVNPCDGISKPESMALVQMLASYVYLYNSSEIKEELLSAKLSSPQFLFSIILVSPRFAANFINMCYESSTKKDYSPQKAVSAFLNRISNIGGSRTSSAEAIDIMTGQGNNVIMENFIRSCVNEDGSINVEDSILRAACLWIIKSNNLVHKDVIQDVDDADCAGKVSPVVIDSVSLSEVLLPVLSNPLALDDPEGPVSFSHLVYSTGLLDKSGIESASATVGKLQIQIQVDAKCETDVKEVGPSDDKVSEIVEMKDDVQEVEVECKTSDTQTVAIEDQTQRYEDSYVARDPGDVQSSTSDIFKEKRSSICNYASAISAAILAVSLTLMGMAFAVNDEGARIACIALSMTCFVISISMFLMTCINIRSLNGRNEGHDDDTQRILNNEVVNETQDATIFPVDINTRPKTH
ncbi:hypothetical protein ECHHL_0241 [Ehrlichia chaffeensis str. Heartland]|uniref:hypothetical protein n=1 Tax=Ehrlichia chaffeensis TaxID=945 RepID=UPI000444DC23|nr:hypothetical protein [Ehrlichia chaffeensis]AHX03407.1 hypothetical protein ECHHL_0241 [Ehrlichia chaffeensis str. Heartland]AHX10792.1 hypothetical protein ECHWP_0239 [Ehrlichia chaffeensis str. West Paces]